MATRTISNTGGNWNSAATWVEGVVPTSADSVIATATSGNINLTVTSDCATINLTNYTGIMSGTGSLRVFAGTCLFSSGMTMNHTGTIQFVNVGCNLTTNGKILGALNLTTSTVNTLNDAVTVNGNLTIGSQQINGFSITFKGNLTASGNQTVLGTTTLIKEGLSGTWSGNLTLRQNITVKAGASLSISGTVAYATGTLTFESGATINPGTSTLNIIGSCTINANSNSLNNLNIVNTANISFNSLLNGNSINLPNANATFSGTSGFVFNSITHTTLTASRVYTFAASNTYTSNVSISLSGTPTNIITLQSSSATIKANLILTYSGAQLITNVNVTRIDSSGGETLYTSIGRVLTDTINWGIITGTKKIINFSNKILNFNNKITTSGI